MRCMFWRSGTRKRRATDDHRERRGSGGREDRSYPVAAAHGMSMAALLRELLARVGAHYAETLTWLDKARR